LDFILEGNNMKKLLTLFLLMTTPCAALTAKEAYTKTKEARNKIPAQIMEDISEGIKGQAWRGECKYSTPFYKDAERESLEVVKKNLQSLGYKVRIAKGESMDYIRVSWCNLK